jgi:chromosome segregation ATPase
MEVKVVYGFEHLDGQELGTVPRSLLVEHLTGAVYPELTDLGYLFLSTDMGGTCLNRAQAEVMSDICFRMVKLDLNAISVTEHDAEVNRVIMAKAIEGESQPSKKKKKKKKVLSQLEQPVGASAQPASLESRLDLMESSFQLVVASNEALRSTLETQCRVNDELRSTVQALQTQCGDNEELRSTVQALETKCGALETKCGALNEDNDELKSTVRALETKCEVLEAKCEALETDLVDVKTLLDLRDATLDLFVSAQRSAIVNYESRIRELKNR